MGRHPVGTPIERGRAAAAVCDWDAAYRCLREADGQGALCFEDLALLAQVAYAAGDLDGTIEVWERAHAERLGAQDPASAGLAATRIALHLMIDTGLMAPVRAWIDRARRLLDEQPGSEVHAWLRVARSYERLLSGDLATAQLLAREAVALAEAHAAPAPRAFGQVAEARGVILGGDVHRGLDLLDDAAVVAMSGEVDPLTVGLIYCELVCAWQGLAQYDRAEEWTEAMHRWCRGHSMGSVRGRCRVHRAEILRLRGRLEAAEREAQRACEELRPMLRREFGWPLTELGRIRLERGDLDGAESAFLEAYEVGWEPEPGYAELRLARGDLESASAAIDDALERPLQIPSKEWPPNTDLRRAPLLATKIEICVSAGDLASARAAVTELSRIATRFGSRALHATAATARGQVRLAAGEPDRAREDFETGVRLWARLGAPYEAALARVGLARSTERCGDGPRALRELRIARSTFARLGAAARTEVSSAAGDGPATHPEGSPPEPVSGGEGSVAARGRQAFVREGDYWTLTYGATTVRLRDLRGLQHLARLLAEPGREFHATDLVAVGGEGCPQTERDRVPGLAADRSGDAGEVLDRRAKEAYRRRLAEVEEDIAEAEAFGDPERASRATLDREFLVRELARAVGLGGRGRRVGSAAERARSSVTRAIRHALGRIREHHPELADHLDATIRTGTYCRYLPDPRAPVAWEL